MKRRKLVGVQKTVPSYQAMCTITSMPSSRSKFRPHHFPFEQGVEQGFEQFGLFLLPAIDVVDPAQPDSRIAERAPAAVNGDAQSFRFAVNHLWSAGEILQFVRVLVWQAGDADALHRQSSLMMDSVWRGRLKSLNSMMSLP